MKDGPVFSQLDRLAKYRDQDMGDGLRKSSRAPRHSKKDRRTLPVDEYMRDDDDADPV